MKEITVTFENGCVFNGSANSMTLNGETTYYFQADKYYRVQVNTISAITMQEYQNTNGAWYPIDIITSVAVAEIETKDAVTKEYLEENYYNKTEVDAKISAIPGSDVTKEWIEQNYYSKPQIDQRLTAYWSKTEADDRFVLKTGDTMTGALNINNAYLNILNARGQTVVSLRQSPSNYGGFINVYDGTGSENYTIQLSGGNHNMRIRNDHNNGDGVYLDGGEGLLYLYEPATLSLYFAIFPYGVTFTGAGGDYTTWQPSGIWFQKNGKNIMTIANNRIDLYNNGSIFLHTGESDTTEQYLVLSPTQFTTYNRATTWGLTIQTGAVKIQGGVDMEAQGNRVSVSAASNVILGTSSKAFTVNNYSTAMQGNFYGGDNFINALNLFLARMQDAIKSASPAYQIVSAIEFGSENFGGGFQAGGGTSRGGGIGRR